nr:hypothetical protein [uncultured Draconibacterium sp.]
MELLFKVLGFDVSAWFTGGGIIVVAGMVVTFLRKKGWIMFVNQAAVVGAKISRKLADALDETADTFEAVDRAIDENGKLIERNVKEVIAQGKEAWIEWEDVIMVLKPKPEINAIQPIEPEVKTKRTSAFLKSKRLGPR